MQVFDDLASLLWCFNGCSVTSMRRRRQRAQNLAFDILQVLECELDAAQRARIVLSSRATEMNKQFRT